MQLVIPFLIISIYSYFISSFFKISIIKSYLKICICLIFLLIFLGKFGLLEYTNALIKYFSFFILVYLIFKKKFNFSSFLEVFFIFILFLLLIWISKDLYYYKFDEFTEYGITSRLIFNENNLPINIEYLEKGSPHKVNFISYFHYFFLKNSTDIFLEEITFLAQSFFIIILMITILSFLDLNLIKKIIIGSTFYFLIYTLGPGFDRLYVDTIVGMFISLILLIFFNKQNKKSDFILLFLIVAAFPMIKPNALVIICGLILIFVFYLFLQKKIISFSIILFAILFNFLFTKLYIFQIENKEIENNYHKGVYHSSSKSFNLGNINQYNLQPFEKIIKNKKIFFDVQIEELKKNGIYHAKSFLILNKIFEKINPKFKMIEIPLNIFVWFLIILLISYFVSKKDNEIKLPLLIFLYLSFLTAYFIFLTYWASRNNLINDDFTMSISWERHLGTIILGIILFLLVHLSQNYKNYTVLISLFIISLNISLPNSLRVFMPLELINKNQFWEHKYKKREDIRNISIEIKKKLNDYSKLYFYINKIPDPYFSTILKYELIKINTSDLTNTNNIIFDYNNFFSQDTKNYIISDYDGTTLLNKIFINFQNNTHPFLNYNLLKNKINQYQIKNIYRYKYLNNNLNIYEISNIQL